MSNPFDEFKPAPAASAFDEFAPADPPTSVVMRQAVKVKPDAAAEADRLARRYPAPYETIKRNADDFQMFDIAEGLAQELDGAPTLAGAFRKNPRLAEMAHDDIGVLSKITGALGALGDAARYAVSAPGTKRGLAGDAVDATKTVGLGATVGVGKAIFDVAAVINDLVGWDSGAAGMRGMAKRAGESMDAAGMEAESSTGKAVKSGLQSAGTNLAMLPLGLARGLYSTASQAATTVAGLMGLTVGADAFNEKREAGGGKLAAAAFGIPQGVFEFVFEKIPASKLFGDLAANAGLWNTLKHQAFSETWTEQATTLAQDFNSWMNLHPEKTVAEFLAERPEAAYQTMVATLVGVGVQTTTIHGLNKAIEKATDQRLQFQQDAFEQLQKLASQSALRERSPEQFRALIQQVVGQSDSAQKSIHVDAQVLSQLGEDVLAQLPESVRAQIPAEAAKNGTVEIGMADVLTVAPGTPLEQILNDHARMTPESMSRADAQAAGDQSQVLRQEAEQVIQQAADQQVAQAEYDQVQQMYAQQVAASGRYRPAVADQMGHWLASFYTAYGARTGMTATEMQAKYPVRVLGVAPAEGQGAVMDQGKPGQLDGVEVYHFSREPRKTLYSSMHGNGLQDANREQFSEAEDPRIRERIYFYADKGTGINPLGGLGGHAHRAKVSNVYDMNADPQGLRKGKTLPAFESAVLDAGFDGYLDRRDGTQTGVIVMLGKRSVDPEYIGLNPDLRPGTRVPSLTPREAPWQVQHTGEPEQLQAKLAKLQSNPAWAGYEARIVGNQLEVRKTGEVYEQKVVDSDVKLPKKVTATTAVDLRKGPPLTGSQGMSIHEVAAFFDKITGKRDFNDPKEQKRAVKQLVAEIEFQLQQEKSGLDWYEDDIGVAFRETATVIPSLADSATKRQLFAVVAGLQSPGTLADANWDVAAQTFEHYEKTGTVPGRNPANGNLWIGGPVSVNKEKALNFLNSMLQDLGEAATVEWLYSEHTVKELNEARKKWGNMGPRVDGKAADMKLGMFAFGPKVGPFVMNINGIHESTVDVWATRTLNRLFGQMTGPDGKIIDAPTEPQRRVAKEIFNAAAEQAGIKPYQVQSVLWFFEQQLFNHLGTGSASLSFSDGARKFAGRRGVQAAGGNDQAAAGTLQQSGELTGRGAILNVGLSTEEVAGGGQIDEAAVRQRLADIGVTVDAVDLHQSDSELTAVVQINRPLTQAEADALSAALQQEAIVQVVDGQGTMFGPKAEEWGPYNPDYFVMPDGTRASAAKVPQTDTPEFQAWSGGNPLVLAAESNKHQFQTGVPVTVEGFHGTRRDFDRHDPALASDGYFLSSKPVVANEYAGYLEGRDNQVNPGGNVQRQFARMDNPLFINARGASFNRVDTRAIPGFEGGALSNTDAINRWAQSQGYDGVVYKDLRDSLSAPDGRNATPSNVYTVFNPTQIKSAIGNDGSFDRNDPSFLSQREAQTPRGTFNPATLDLVLNPNANLTTFFHETGHFFLEVMADIASQPNAPAQIVADMATFLKWAGIPDLATWNQLDLEGKRASHERWAESVEQYVMEGKAPSVELQPLMRRFATWLKSVYGSIKAFLASRGQAAAGGTALEQRVTRNDKLAQWFGTDSTMVTPDGTPRVLYHGTTKAGARGAKAGQFKRSKIGAMGPAVYLGDDAEASAGYDRGAMLKVYARGKYLNNRQWTEYVNKHGWSGAEAAATADGWAGVYDEMFENAIAVWNPENIKSVDAKQFADDGMLLSQDGQPQPGPPMALNDDIRRVMDRMLATDAQIAQANEVSGLLPDLEADALAAERLNKRSMADLKWAVRARDAVIAKLRKQAKAVEKGIREEVTAEVNAMREVQARDLLAKSQKDNDGKLNETERAIIADAFGYESVDAMLQSIDAFGSKADAIDGMTQQRMLQEHGDLTDEDAIRQAALEAVHNEARARSLATELRTQREMLNPRQDTGEVNAKGIKITVNALVEAAKQFAANVVARTPLRDLKAKAWQHTAAERRAGTRWAEATAAGKTQEAVQAKQDQMLNNAAAKAALDARLEMGKILEFFKRVVKGNDEKVVEKGRDPDIVNAARAVLAAYGIETPASKGADAYLEVLQRNDPETHGVIAPMVAGALQNAQPIEALTFEELQGLHEEIQAMWFLAKRSRQMEVNGDMLDRDDLAQELRARMEEIGIPDRVPGEGKAVTKAEDRALFLRQGISFLRRVEQWAEGFDGKYGGPFLRYVFQPVKAAADNYRTDRASYRKKLQVLVDNIAPVVGDQIIKAPELNYEFGTPGSTRGTAMNEILHAIAHTGNESNKRKLLLGRGWATENADGTMDTSKWDSFVQRLIVEGKLERAHYDFVQGLWDLMEETKPLAQKAHRDAFGRYFAEVTADAFTDPFGVPRRGGYAPAIVDSEQVKDNELRKLAEAENENMAFAFPAPGKGFTKGRVEYNRPLLLDLRTLGQHLDKVLLFSHLTVPARDVRRLITDKSVGQALTRIDPSVVSGMLQPWLQRSAQQVVEDPIVGAGKWARVPSIIRARAGAALMFANVSNTIQQVTGLSTALVKVGPGHMMRAVAQHVAHPVKAAQTVWEASPYMDDRANNEVAVLNEQMQDILLNPSTYEKAQAWSMRNAYFLQTLVDNALSPIVWTGAYNQAMTDGMTHEDAVRFADGTVRQTQGSTLPEDVSRLETGPAYARAFTQFIGYFNMVANTNATALKQIAGEVGLKKGAGRALGVVMAGLLVPLWVAEAIAQAFKGGPDDEDKDGYLDDWLAAVFGFGTIKGLLAMIPIVGQAANSAVSRLDNNPMNDRISLSPGLSLLESALGGNVQTVHEILSDSKEVNARRAVRDAATLVSVFTGLPAYAVARPLGYAAGIADDKIQPTGPADAARGLITGTASPASKVK